ncbi:hypothetical protein [Pseudomonas putida]|uniref:hypothetical protein n=1 Tax=Pseudomonas putida TaxID=303 RepID=UPI002366D0E0|nr:hypothetical protein [Pseudomonas putida]MDD2049843.1 hypothetical protein [Pseudomonas putida]
MHAAMTTADNNQMQQEELGMNRQIATLAQISPHQVRQGLLFSLALLLTLIAGHLHHSWQLVQDARAVAAQASLMIRISVPAQTTLMQSQPAVASSVPADVRAPNDRWVF